MAEIRYFMYAMFAANFALLTLVNKLGKTRSATLFTALGAIELFGQLLQGEISRNVVLSVLAVLLIATSNYALIKNIIKPIIFFSALFCVFLIYWIICDEASTALLALVFSTWLICYESFVLIFFPD